MSVVQEIESKELKKEKENMINFLKCFHKELEEILTSEDDSNIDNINEKIIEWKSKAQKSLIEDDDSS
eukprot:TRINITY_DN67951_c0_g1_i1.p1 TRINITY_DN67951_c0_g1~~TRINITY_DN67951_c0_g1_i1.p1  ORF type:complete len:68 (-),score=9.84 TRINITY_DN67951_c0_g1_i1:7-210(-)